MEFHYSKQRYTLEQLLDLEWLDTNGLGGYASTTILGCHSRKYHGLLVCKLAEFPDKYVLLSKLDDNLIINDKEYPLTLHQYSGSLNDAAFKYFYEFTLTSHPQLIYKIDENIYLSKEIIMVNGENTVLVKYKLVGAKDATLRIRPLLAYRNFHALTKENSVIKREVSQTEHGFRCEPYQNMPGLTFATFPAFGAHATFTRADDWYRNFTYNLEAERGYEFTEDLFSPGIIELSFKDNREFIIAFSLTDKLADVKQLWTNELRQRKEVEGKFHGSRLQQHLKKTALAFLQKDPITSATSIIAGYHWFLAWGRDAMISLPGLTLYSNLEAECLEVLQEFARHEKDGLIPNFIGSRSEDNAYNSVDASLWFCWAVQQYYAKTKDSKEIALHIWPTLKNIFNNYKNGTIYNIKMQETGLLYAGSKSINLTWMDAMLHGQPVTPRYGLQVEVNALWFNLLCFMQELAEIFVDPIKNEITQLLPKIRLNFCQTFYAKDLGYLYDFVNMEEKNAQLRPNQMFAVSLPYSPLPKKIAIKVMDKVKEHLLTPFGLRTLSPQDQNYQNCCQGVQEVRDIAYHNGVVWPWLIGHFGEALLKVYNKKLAVETLQPCLDAFNTHLYEGGIGGIAEIFSGDAPHNAGGCIYQAWSIAEVLRLTYLLNAQSTET